MLTLPTLAPVGLLAIPALHPPSEPACHDAARLAGGGKFHRKTRRKISTPAEVLPGWKTGIEAEVNNPVIRDALWFGLYTGMRLDEVLTLRWERVDMAAMTQALRNPRQTSSL